MPLLPIFLYIRRFVLVFFCLIAISNATAQDITENFRYYGETGGGGGTLKTIKLGYNVNFLKHHTISILYYFNWGENDFGPRITGLKLFPWNGDGRPTQYLGMFAFTYGRMITVSQLLRFNLKAGITTGRYNYADNFQRTTGWFAASHSYDRIKKPFIGAIVNPTAEFPLSENFGLNIGFTGAINTQKSVWGIEGGILFGRLREEFVPKD